MSDEVIDEHLCTDVYNSHFVLHTNRCAVLPLFHYLHNLFVISALEEQALGQVNSHFVACQREGDRTASSGAILEVGAISAFFIDFGKLAHRGADLCQVSAHLQKRL